MAAVEAAIAASGTGVMTRNLQIVDKKVMADMKEGESEKQKSYHAVCWASRELTAADEEILRGTKELTIHQGTPVRVLHRRAPLVRDRVWLKPLDKVMRIYRMSHTKNCASSLYLLFIGAKYPVNMLFVFHNIFAGVRFMFRD